MDNVLMIVFSIQGHCVDMVCMANTAIRIAAAIVTLHLSVTKATGLA